MADLIISAFESKIDDFHLPFSDPLIPNRCNFPWKNYTLSTTDFVNVKLNLAWIKGILSYSHHPVPCDNRQSNQDPSISQIVESSKSSQSSITDYSHLTFILIAFSIDFPSIDLHKKSLIVTSFASDIFERISFWLQKYSSSSIANNNNLHFIVNYIGF